MIHPETVTKLLFPIDTRFRYKPELPPAGLLRQRGGVPTSCYEGKDVGIGTVTVRGGFDIGGEEGRVVGDEYRMSVLDSIEGNGRRAFCRESALVVSDMSRLRFAEVDFGWGPAVYGGPARAGTGHVPGMVREELRGCWLWFPPCLHMFWNCSTKRSGERFPVVTMVSLLPLRLCPLIWVASKGYSRQLEE